MSETRVSSTSVYALSQQDTPETRVSSTSVYALHRGPVVDTRTSSLSVQILERSPAVQTNTSSLSVYVLADFIPIPPDEDRACAAYEPIDFNDEVVQSVRDGSEIVVFAPMECSDGNIL